MLTVHMHVNEHEGAAVVSADYSSETVRDFAGALYALAQRIEANGAIIGHIKGFTEPSGAAAFSITDVSSGVSVIYKTDVKLGLTAICYNISPEMLAEYVLDAVRAAACNHTLEAELCSENHTETI
jgi:hypothetical protein